MKLTKKIEIEIWKIYDTWMQGYLNADVETYNYYFDENYHFIGSTNNEEFLNKKDTTDFFRATGDQFAGMTDLRKETKTLEVFGEHVFITHFFDAWFKNDKDWSYYGRFRFSSVMHKTKEGWRFIYQHFSMPDSKSEEGQTIGFDKVHLENQELREAIQRRTTELEQKNRELEVETALERIRAQAVAMKESSDLLDIVVTMRNEFIKLGHEAHYFWHMMWLPKTYEKAMTSGDGSKIGFVMELPRHIHGDIPQLAKWEKSKKPTVIYTMNVEDAIDYVDKMVALGNFKNIDPQAPTHDDIKHIGGLTFIMARTTHGEIGYSLPGIVNKPPKEDIDILVKFAGAFDLAHQRFLDLQKAEKQARETQIELSLERIRSRVTAMQESSDLFDIVVTMRNEFLSLGHEADYFWHMKWTKDNYEMSMTAEDGGRLGMVITVPKFVHEQIESLHKWEESNSPYFVLALNGKDAWDYIEKMNTYGKYKLVDPHAPTEEDILHIGGLTFIIARTTHGEIGFSLAGKIDNPPKASIDILVRFASVFDLAYKRFEDLKKAEAQARETQIELALEKVRSRTMAMQHSDELQEASFLLDQQVRALGIKTWGCAFNIYGENESTEWFGNEAGVLHTYTVPREGIFKVYYDKGLKGETLFIQEFSGDDCLAHYEYMSSLPVIGDVLKTLKKTNNGFPTYQIDHVVYFKYGYLLFITREHVPDSHDIFKRFAKVFEQTYTRFLDLKKAEAQTREAQIETALERVRSRSISMHKSEELAQVVLLLDEELMGLGIEVHGTQILTDFDNPEKNVTVWFGMKGKDYLERFHVPYFDHPISKIFHSRWKKDIDFYTEQYSKTDKNKFFRLLVKNSDFRKITEERQKFIYDSPGLTRASVLFQNSILIFQRYNLSEFLEEEVAIFKRFGKVFEQAYTRFIDLQKAEAQAKEAQIEAALERVRSRSMAMHKSEEIGDVAFVLFEQLKSLGGELWGTGFGFCEQDSKVDKFWFANENGIMPHLKIPNDVDETHKKMYQGWKKNLESLSIAKEGKELKEHYKYMLSVHDVKPIFQGMLDNGIKFPKWQKWHAAYFKYGYLLVITTEEYKNETIFKRFAKVFEQAYTRFLDLKKAEAQAREAQIETALERVRSRSMAMHNSEELKEVIQVLYDQFIHLNINIEHAGFILDYKENDDMHIWLADHNAVFPKIVLPYFDCAHWNSFIEAKKEGRNFFANQLGFEEKNKFYKDLFKHIPNLPEETKTTYFGFKGLAISTVLLDNVGLYIENYSGNPFSEEDNNILMRFGKVFQQSYTRFLDLKRAEAQAREAQIETALEKVRSRTMAMQHSDELPEAANNLFLQVQTLSIPAWSAGYCIWEDESKKSTWCNMSSEGEIQKGFSLPSIGEGYDFYEPFKKKESFHVAELGGEALVKHYDFMKTLPGIGEILVEFDEKGIALPTFQIFHIVYFTHGYLMFITYETVPEAHQIFKRFGQVFEQTYTRFQDLKLKEEQSIKLEEEKQRLEKTLKDLQATQTQLIQSEKMASLGELTAGIAHEIQNPLNFVNNFSEVSKELLDEMLEEMENGDMEEVKAIMDDVIQNLEKINHHGKRADGIVKGMLQHSRASGDKKEPTNINVLADEYLRLAYHGLRAKDKSFNATLETNFDDTLTKINVIPQDIGRVVLNLLTNAFYVVNEKKHASQNDYEPTVSISTKKKDNWVTISVKDNGNGIPKKVLDKIFQPFFTTKPTGQGTGLGLSMSYDIVTKGHGGELKVNTEQNKGTEFIIELPNN